MTSAQLATLKTDIANSGLGTANPNTPDGNQAIADAYNAIVTPDFWVWKSKVTRDELVSGVSVDGTTFNWTGAGYMTRSQGERDGFNAVFDSAGTVNPSRASVRQAFADMFSGGTAPAPANRTHLLAMSRRLATRAEKLFATGTGTTGSPATLVFEGQVSQTDVLIARSLP